MAALLEDALSKLMVPDNSVIFQATQQLRECFKDPGVIAALCSILSTSQNVQVRQTGAVLLRRRILKARHWRMLDDATRQGLKENIIQILLKETQKPVAKSIAQVIAIVAKHELAKDNWPQLLAFLNQFCQSTNLNEREMGLFTLCEVTSEASEQLKPHLVSLLGLMSGILGNSSDNPKLLLYAVRILTNLVWCVGTAEMNSFQYLIPPIMNVVKLFLEKNEEDDTCELMEIFEELVETEVAVVMPHLKPLIEMYLQIAANTNLPSKVRVKALHLIDCLITLKKKTFTKQNLLDPILNVMFPIMCEPSDDDENDDSDSEDDDDDSLSPSSAAAQVVDVMALHLPPEKLITPLSQLIQPAFQSFNPLHRKAAYLALAVVVEGCSETIRHKYMAPMLQTIFRGISDENPSVKNAALFALGQFAEYLQPEIGNYAGQILPVLFTYMHETCRELQQGGKQPSNLSRTFYALESFCENLEDGLLPYLPQLMECYMLFLTTTQSVRAKELSISGIAALANSAKENMAPYFRQILDHVNIYFQSPQPKEHLQLQVQSLYALGVLAKTVGTECFTPVANDCIVLALTLLADQEQNDSDIKRFSFRLLGSVSCVLKEKMEPYLATAIPEMIKCLNSEPDDVKNGSDSGAAMKIFDSFEVDASTMNDENDDDSSEDEALFGNSYVEEKEDACASLGDLAENVGQAFIPYYHLCVDEVAQLMAHPSYDIRDAAISAMVQFILCIHKVANNAELKQTEIEHLKMLVPVLIKTAREDDYRSVVATTMQALNDLLKEMKLLVLEYGTTLENIMSLVHDAFKLKLTCQDQDDDDDSEQAEYDSMVVEYAGELIPTLASFIPPAHFTQFFELMLPMFLSKTKKTASVMDKSFAIGTLAEVVENLDGGNVDPFFHKLLPIFLTGMKDDNEEVRSNSIFGLGVLVESAKEVSYSHYPTLLSELDSALSKEGNPRAKDNICAAVCRFIMTNSAGVPLKQVVPVVLQCLPLKEDFEENFIVFKCLFKLYSEKNEEVFSQLGHILTVISSIINTNQANKETRSMLTQFVNTVRQEYPDEFEKLFNTLPSDNKEALGNVIV